jgi:hypothetical protein
MKLDTKREDAIALEMYSKTFHECTVDEWKQVCARCFAELTCDDVREALDNDAVDALKSY